MGRIADIRRTLPDDYWIVWFGTLVNRCGGFVGPLLTFYLTGDRHMSIRTAGLVVALFGGGGALAALVGGVLADRVGRKATMLMSMIGGGVMMASLGFQRDVTAIAINTFALGFVGELYRPAVMAYVGDVVPPSERLRAFGYLYWVINLSFAFASVMGGLLSKWSYTALFIGDAITMFGFAALIAVRVPETRPAHPPPEPGERRRVSLLDVLTDRAFMTFWGLSFLWTLIIYQSAVPLSAQLVQQGYDQSAYGVLLAVNGVLIVLLQPGLTKWGRHRDRTRLLALSVVLLGGGMALHGVSALIPLHVLAILFWTTGEIIAAPVNSTVVTNMASVEARGRYQGTYGMSWSLASMAGPIIGSTVFEQAGPATLWSGCLGLGLVVAVGFLATGAGRRARGA
ncbi:MAG TPA: MFS transporter [Kofleriaceae bacterium]|nr:MFS transporter [Kofleriaceae bacterium]